MRKYRKKPVVIEAFEWPPVWHIETRLEFEEWVKSKGDDLRQFYYVGEMLQIDTLEGVMSADVGDYIIRGVNGEYYPCKPDIFEKTYELVE